MEVNKRLSSRFGLRFLEKLCPLYYLQHTGESRLGAIESESWQKHPEYACDMRMSFSLLADSYDEGAGPWEVVPVGLQFIDVVGGLTMYLAEGRSKHQPFARHASDDVFLFASEFDRSCGAVQHGLGINR